MSPEQRVHFHQVESGPRMKDLEAWFKKQFAERKVEPNSGLGEAILYMQKYWDKLTLFLRQAGPPLDNNIVEQSPKMAILHRKNALFYKTQNGARVGVCGANAFDYLTELQKHRRELFQDPSEWMPWNYRNALERGVTSGEAPS
jgi:transposase